MDFIIGFSSDKEAFLEQILKTMTCKNLTN